MRLPPDVLASLIKLKDFVFLFGPAILIAVTLKAALTSILPVWFKSEAGLSVMGRLLLALQKYLQASNSPSIKLAGLFRHEFKPEKTELASSTLELKKLWFDTIAVTTSVAAILTALVLSPIFILVRLSAGVGFALLSRVFLSRSLSHRPSFEKEVTTVNKAVSKRASIDQLLPLTQYFSSRTDLVSKKVSQSQIGFLRVFYKNWLVEFDPYSNRVFYNFGLAALFTIFVPFRLVDSWFGIAAWAGPLLTPLLGLLLMPVAGAEIAAVLALSLKGASTGSLITALLAFPLITFVGLAQKWQYYGWKDTLKFSLLVWLFASGFGYVFNILGVTIDV